MSVGWEHQAQNWITIARSRDDSYWGYRDAFFELVPEPGERTLEIGCGEGRVMRDLAELGHVTVDGVTMRFVGWCYPLEDYTRALEDAGFLIEVFREPAVDRSPVSPRGKRRPRIPNFLFIRAVKPA